MPELSSTSEIERFVSLLFARRWWILGMTLATTLAAVVLLFTTPRVYRANAVIMPADATERRGDLSSVLGQYSGLASLAGVNLGRGDEGTEAVAILKSRQFTQDFISDKNLLSRLFYKRWDSEARGWKNPESKPPSLWDAYKLFDRQIRKVIEDKKTGLITVQVDWIDRNEAAQWANELVMRINTHMRREAIQEADKSVEYLNKELMKTNVVAIEQAIYRLIETSVKEKTLAIVTDEYAFKVLDPAAPPDASDPFKPKSLTYLIGGPLLGVLLSILLILTFEFFFMVKRRMRRGNSASS